MQHPSPCELVSSIADDYPDKCDGSVACACVGGTASCHSTGTDTFDRIALFTGVEYSKRAENIAFTADPVKAQNMWLNEDGGNSGVCENVGSNGHRWSILSPDYNAIGVGTVNLAVQDFSSIAKESSPLSSGSHYLNGTLLWFKTHYYASVEASQVKLVLGDGDDRCRDLTLAVGSATNGVYGISGLSGLEACTPYYYEVVDADGTYTKFPTQGSLLYDCEK